MGDRLEFKLNIHNNVLALSLDTRADKVLVGDLMQSISVLSMTNRDPLSLKLLAIDSKPTWMTAVKFVNEFVFIGADDRNNVFTLTLDSHPRLGASQKTGTGILRLELQGGFHIGSLINCFREGAYIYIYIFHYILIY
jgi:DNA damage-binding protein 1